MFNKKMRVCAAVIAGVLVLAGVTACGSGRGGDDAVSAPASWGRNEWLMVETADMAYGAHSMPMATPVPGTARAGQSQLWSVVSPQEGDSAAVGWEDIAERDTRHIIRRAMVEMVGEYFDDTVVRLRAVPAMFAGYIEQETLTTTGRPRLTIVMRVPSESFDDALEHIEALPDIEIRHRHQSADDVTDRFHDLAGSLETRRIEEERVLALIEQAETIYERLALETRLSNVRQTIESYLSQLNHMAGQIAYSTITVTLTCIAQEEIAAAYTLGERIGGAFGDSVDSTIGALQSVVVFLAAAVVPGALLAIIGGAVWLIVRRIRRGLTAS